MSLMILPRVRFVSFLLLCLPAAAAPASPDEDGEARGIHQLDRLVVSTGTRTERLLSEVPVRTEVVLREDIWLRSAMDFCQAIELLNGVRVGSNCQNCNTTEVQLLGLGGAYNQILFDGTPLLSSLGGVYGLEQIPAAFVDRLEVVKGGGSSLYGAGAVAGVINLVPVPPLTTGGFLQAGVEVQRGVPMQQVEVRSNHVAVDGKLRIALVAQGAQNEAIDFDGDGYAELTEREMRVAGFQLWYAPTTHAKLRANYQFTREYRRGGNRIDQPPHLANIAEALRTRYHRGGVVWDQVIGPDLDFRAGYSFAQVARDSFYGGLGDVSTDPADPAYDPAELDPFTPGSAAAASYAQYGRTLNPLHYLDVQFNHRRGSHVLAFGVQHRRESVTDRNLDFAGVLLRPETVGVHETTGAFVQDEWTVSPRLDLVLGGRLDRSTGLDRAIFSPRVAAAYEVSPRLKLRAGFSTGFRAPEIFSEDLHIETLGAGQVRIRNAPGLAEEHAVIGLAGFEWRPDPADGRWVIDATISAAALRDTFVLGEIRTDADGFLYQQRTNASGSRVGGAEANLSFEPSAALRLTAGVSWHRSRYGEAEVVFDDTPEGGTTLITTRDYLRTPRLGAVAQAVWTPHHSIDAYLGLKYTGRMDALNQRTGMLIRTPDFWVVDVGGTRHFQLGRQHLDLTIGVKNLLDQRQRDLEAGANRDSTYVYGPRLARSFHASLRYEW